MAKLFWDAYPAYLNMGMSSDEYWDGDAQACVAYRKAYDHALEMQDAMLWRQGLYFYHAMCSAAPYFNSIKPKRPEKYLEKPFGMKPKEPDSDSPDPNIEIVKAWAQRVNAMRNQNGDNTIR